MEQRGGFIFYRSFHEAVKDLPADLYKEILSAVIEYALDGTDPELSPVARCAFLLVKPQIDANNRRRENGSKGGRPRTEQAEKETEEKPKETEEKPNYNQEETGEEPTPKHPEPKEESIKYKDKDKRKNIDKAIYSSTGEPLPAPPEADCESIPLNDGTEWKPPADLFAEWERLYPGVDVRQKIRDMRGWCLSNPTRRKTRRGVQAFVTGWLSREQNKAPAQPQAKRKTRFDNFPGHDTDYDALMWGMVAGGKQ